MSINIRTAKRPPGTDGRRKIAPEQQAELKRDHEEKQLSYKKLAELYSISITMAYYICNPEKMQENIKRRAKNWKRYHSKKKDTSNKKLYMKRKANALGVKKRKYTKDKSTK